MTAENDASEFRLLFYRSANLSIVCSIEIVADYFNVLNLGTITCTAAGREIYLNISASNHELIFLRRLAPIDMIGMYYHTPKSDAMQIYVKRGTCIMLQRLETRVYSAHSFLSSVSSTNGSSIRLIAKSLQRIL